MLDDVTVTQESAVWQPHQANPSRGLTPLPIGHAHRPRPHRLNRERFCSCTPAPRLPLLILFTQTGVRRADVVTEETVAAEVVRTLVGSIVIADRDAAGRLAGTDPEEEGSA